MTTNDDMTPRQPDEGQPPEQLLGDALDLVDETVARITDAEVSEHLRTVLSQSGYASQLAAFWQPRGMDVSLTDLPNSMSAAVAPEYGTATDIIATAWANARLSSERLRQAQEALEVATREAEEIVAAAREEADGALKQAAKMVRDARSQAERIISDARREADQIVTAAQDWPTRQMAPQRIRVSEAGPTSVLEVEEPAGRKTRVTPAGIAVLDNNDLAADTPNALQLAVGSDSKWPDRLAEEVHDFLEARTGWSAAPAEIHDYLASSARKGWSADRAVTELYSSHYRSLVRLAALLVRDTPTAEEVVQDSFVAMHGGWQRLRDAEKALAYLRQAVVNRSRSVLRHRTATDKNPEKAPPDMPTAESGAIVLLERSAVVAALRGLPERQREAIVLRYYADLSEAEIATAMGISRGAVKSHTARGMSALRAALEQSDSGDDQKLWGHDRRARANPASAPAPGWPPAWSHCPSGVRHRTTAVVSQAISPVAQD
jgi:RNA polymerase sigma-70 factor (sigma-E family)